MWFCSFQRDNIMIKFTIFCLTFFCAINSAESLRGTVCKFYEDVTEACSCTEQTIVVQNNECLIEKSKISETVTRKVEENPCQPDPCLNGGLCYTRNEDYLCKCPVGYKAQDCSEKYCPEGFLYENQCINFTTTCDRVTFQQAQNICNSRNSSLAEITSEAMYNIVYEYLVPDVLPICGQACGLMEFWLGSTFKQTNNPNDEITLRNGSKVISGNWLNFAPYKASENSGFSSFVNLVIRVHPGGADNGIFNQPSTGPYRPLCSYNT